MPPPWAGCRRFSGKARSVERNSQIFSRGHPVWDVAIRIAGTLRAAQIALADHSRLEVVVNRVWLISLSKVRYLPLFGSIRAHNLACSWASSIRP